MRAHRPDRAGSRLAAALGALVISAGASFAADPPPIVDRTAWGAKPANTALMTPQNARAIIIHHTSVRQQPQTSLEKKLRGLQGFSQRQDKVGSRVKPAWGDMPYHFYVGVDGRIGEGRAMTYAGDTNTKYNTVGYIQVVVEGDFEKEEPTPAQLIALERLVVWLAQTHAVPAAAITAHNDHAATDCPGKALKPFLAQLRSAVAGQN